MEPQQAEPHLGAPCAHLEVSAASRPAAASAVALPLLVFTPKKALMLTKTEQSAAAVEQCPALPGGWGQQRAVEPQHRIPLGLCSCCRMGLTGRLVAARNAWGWARRGRGEPEEIPWGRSAGGGVGCGEHGGSTLLARCWLHPAGPRAAVGSLLVWKPGGAWPESSVLAWAPPKGGLWRFWGRLWSAWNPSTSGARCWREPWGSATVGRCRGVPELPQRAPSPNALRSQTSASPGLAGPLALQLFHFSLLHPGPCSVVMVTRKASGRVLQAASPGSGLLLQPLLCPRPGSSSRSRTCCFGGGLGGVTSKPQRCGAGGC